MKQSFKYGDICLVDFNPSRGHEFKKERPAIIIQSNDTIKRTNLITVMALTSNIVNMTEDDVLIKKDINNRLNCDSIAKVQAIHAFDKKERFKKKIGEVCKESMTKISNYLKIHFNI